MNSTSILMWGLHSGVSPYVHRSISLSVRELMSDFFCDKVRNKQPALSVVDQEFIAHMCESIYIEI